MMMPSRLALQLAAGVCGSLFLGYCVYFDHKRRSQPDYKKKIKERRMKSKRQKATGAPSEMPDFKDPEAMQRYFLQEVQIGEEQLALGDFENGVEHLSNAVAVCGQPQQLLQVLQQTLPPNVFHMLIQRLPAVSQRMTRNASSSAILLEEDVE